MREEIYRSVLPNGLTMLVNRKPGFRRKFAVIATRYGSADHRYREGKEVVDLPDGIAHFLEHKLFKRKDGDVSEVFAAQGASSNAATSFRTTSYHFSCTDRFEENLRTLVSFVGDPYITDRAVERERGIIEQEIKMYEDNPSWRVVFNLLGALYHSHPVRIDIGGTAESIAKINREALLRCYDRFYRPARMVLVAAGDLDPERAIRIAADATDSWRTNGGPGAAVEAVLDEEPATVVRKTVKQQLDVIRPKVAIGFKDEPVGTAGRELLRRQVFTNMALDLVLGPASPAYSQLYESGVIDETFNFGYTGEPDFGFTVIGGDTSKPEAMRRGVLSAIEKARKASFTNADVARARKKALGKYLRALNSPASTADALMYAHFTGVPLSDYMIVVERVTRHDLQERLDEHLTADRAAVSIVSGRS